MCTRIPRIQLSDNVQVDLHVPEHSKDVQRAVSISNQGIFVSIDGPQEQLEELLDCPPTSLDGSERGLQVNSKLWELLRQGEQNACDAMEKRVRAAVKDNPELDLVICGHGLGGALALLAAASFLDHDVSVSAVIVFGCPQVVVLDPSNRMWRQLHDKTTIYINAFDPLPRAPWCFQPAAEDCAELQHVLSIDI